MKKKEIVQHRGKLTPKVRLFLTAYTLNPEAGPEAAALKAGYTASSAKKAARILDVPAVKKALAETMAPIMEKHNVTRDGIIKRVAEKFYDTTTTPSEVARLGKLLAEMTPGALVPVQVNHRELSLEDFIEAGGGKPTSALHNDPSGDLQ